MWAARELHYALVPTSQLIAEVRNLVTGPLSARLRRDPEAVRAFEDTLEVTSDPVMKAAIPSAWVSLEPSRSGLRTGVQRSSNDSTSAAALTSALTCEQGSSGAWRSRLQTCCRVLQTEAMALAAAPAQTVRAARRLSFPPLM
jgi:hypothetical protein